MPADDLLPASSAVSSGSCSWLPLWPASGLKIIVMCRCN